MKKMKAIIVSAQFLVELPEGVPLSEAEEYGIDWLLRLDSDALDYRHPKVMGVYVRPVPVLVINPDSDRIFDDINLIQL